MPKKAGEVLRERLAALIKPGQQERMSGLAGMSAETFSLWRNHKRYPNPDLGELERIADAFQVSIAKLICEDVPLYDEPESRTEALPKEWEPYHWLRIEAEVGAGPGSQWRDEGPPKDPLEPEPMRDWRDVVPVHRDELWQWGGPAKVRAARVRQGRHGTSMMPVIQPGAILLVQAGPFDRIASGDIYVCLDEEEGVVVKRVFAAGDQLVLWSENPSYEPRAHYVTIREEDESFNRIVRGRVVKVIENL